MRKEEIDEIREAGLQPIVTRGRLQILDPENGRRLTYFPEMGAFYGIFKWYDRERGKHFTYLGVCASMRNSLMPELLDERDERDHFMLFDVGEVSAINEACAEEIALLETWFGQELPSSCWTGR